MASVASQLIQEVTAHAQSDSLEDAREICADGTYFPNNLRTCLKIKGRCFVYYIMPSLHNIQNSCTITTGYIRLHVSAVTRPSSGQQEIAECKQL